MTAATVTTIFAERVLHWYAAYGRKDLPWQVKDPYRVWISEIMLQQTQVKTVLPYYTRFMARFPTVASLADAEPDFLLLSWSGLGYYARARNLHRAAIIVRDNFGGEFPRQFDDVVALPGIGRSTAGAILSLACDQRHVILDGNVKRVLARHAMISGWPGNTAVAEELWQLAEELTPSNDVAAYNQAMMDIGATLCTRAKPQCERCPVSADCQAFLHDAVQDYPEKKPARKNPERKCYLLLLRDGDSVLLERRPPQGIWGGLWSFPELVDLDAWCAERNIRTEDVVQLEPVTHVFSHFRLTMIPVQVSRQQADWVSDRDSEWYDVHQPVRVGMAAPIKMIFESLREHEHA